MQTKRDSGSHQHLLIRPSILDIKNKREQMLDRIGIATDEVVVGDLVGQDTKGFGAVTGETPNLAARLQNIAEV